MRGRPADQEMGQEGQQSADQGVSIEVGWERIRTFPDAMPRLHPGAERVKATASGGSLQALL
jgi:hypothetical protein